MNVLLSFVSPGPGVEQREGVWEGGCGGTCVVGRGSGVVGDDAAEDGGEENGHEGEDEGGGLHVEWVVGVVSVDLFKEEDLGIIRLRVSLSGVSYVGELLGRVIQDFEGRSRVRWIRSERGGGNLD